MPRGLIVVGRIAWILPAIIGLGLLNWLAFSYPGIRMRKQHPVWFWIFIGYSIVTIPQIILISNSDADSPGMWIYILIWLSAIVAFLIMLKWWIPFKPAKTTVEVGQQMPVTVAVETAQKATSSSAAPTQAPGLPDTSKVAPSPAAVASPQQPTAVTPAAIPDAPPAQRVAPKVFISHATEDRESTSVLARELEQQGIETWLAFRDVQVGDNYAEEIVKAIGSADYILVVLSESAIESPHVRREVTIGIDRGVPLLPVNMSASEDFMWSLPVDWTYWLSLAQVLRHTDEASTAQELARRITRTRDSA